MYNIITCSIVPRTTILLCKGNKHGKKVMTCKYESVIMVVSTHSSVAPVDQWVEHQHFTQNVIGSSLGCVKFFAVKMSSVFSFI